MAGELPPSLLVLVVFFFWCSSHCQAWATCVSREEIARGRYQPLDQCFFVAAVKMLATGGQDRPVRKHTDTQGWDGQSSEEVQRKAVGLYYSSICNTEVQTQTLFFNMTQFIIQNSIFSHPFTASCEKQKVLKMKLSFLQCCLKAEPIYV